MQVTVRYALLVPSFTKGQKSNFFSWVLAISNEQLKDYTNMKHVRLCVSVCIIFKKYTLAHKKYTLHHCLHHPWEGNKWLIYQHWPLRSTLFEHDPASWTQCDVFHVDHSWDCQKEYAIKSTGCAWHYDSSRFSKSMLAKSFSFLKLPWKCLPFPSAISSQALARDH